MNPLQNNDLETRADHQRAVRQLYEPLRSRFMESGAGLVFNEPNAPKVKMSGYARPLFGIVPLVAGGGAFDDWDRYRRGLVAGTDPDHDDYWGPLEDSCQQFVEFAPVGFALACTPEHLWEPLDVDEKAQVATFLEKINTFELPDDNWLFFQVLTNLGLREVGRGEEGESTRSALDRLESFALPGGWYRDGYKRTRDYYIAWAMHTYGLVYAVLNGEDDPERASRFRKRARSFAQDYRDWFDGRGRALPYGRSLGYRFAQASFWGALAYARENPFPWPEIRGLWQRNINWWLDQPIFEPDGTLSVGYRYSSSKPTTERYMTRSAVYWALKAFLPLALPDNHPFWQADPEPLSSLPPVRPQSEANQIVCRDGANAHHYALTAGPADQPFYVAGSYGKFAYSTSFGFSASTDSNLAASGHDSSLALSTDGRQYHPRRDLRDQSVDETQVHATWDPWDGVTVESWTVPSLPWHIRIHRCETDQQLQLVEGGFPIPNAGEDDHQRTVTDSRARFTTSGGTSEIIDPLDHRSGTIVHQTPETNVMHEQTTVPTLCGELSPGVQWHATTAVATPTGNPNWGNPPSFERHGDGLVVTDDEETILDTR